MLKEKELPENKRKQVLKNSAWVKGLIVATISASWCLFLILA